MVKSKPPNQIVGNVGLYYACCELSKCGWNVLPTSRNAKGVDVVIYNQSATRTHTIQVKALSKKNPVPFGGNLDSLLADYVVICTGVFDEKPEIFIAKASAIRPKIHEGIKDGKKSYWLQPKDYKVFKVSRDRDIINTIGEGYD
ncbi:MAG TPA: hypothetical protein ACFYD1_04090 [Candidatus Hypogeohydataceae bacterium YC38]|nr:hypothetical protein [Candidatus Brocadiales bacterium]